MSLPNLEQTVKIYKDLFLSTFDRYQHVYTTLLEFYRYSPQFFADSFFENLPDMDSKVVRMICYQLYDNNISIDKLYNDREYVTLPDFLWNLDTFSSEKLLILMKYGFPTFPDSNIFFWRSMSKDGEWLSFALDISFHLNINLNHINEDGRTILHKAISNGDTPAVMKILYHRANPNLRSTQDISPLTLAISLLNYPDAVYNYSIYLEMIKQLSRYGAEYDSFTDDLLNGTQFKDKILRAIQAGRSIPVEYFVENPQLMDTEIVEDMAVISQADPDILTNESFQHAVEGTNLVALRDAIKYERDQSIMTRQGVMTWPHYINSSKTYSSECPLALPERIVAESPPDSETLNKIIYDSFRDYHPQFDRFRVSPAKIDKRSLAIDLSDRYEQISPVLPLAMNPISPTSSPRLPRNL